MNLRVSALATALLVSTVPALPVSAQAAPVGRHGGWSGWHGGGWGSAGLGVGLATGAIIGAALAAPYYDYGYYAPGYAYAPEYAYAPGYAYAPATRTLPATHTRRAMHMLQSMPLPTLAGHYMLTLVVLIWDIDTGIAPIGLTMTGDNTGRLAQHDAPVGRLFDI